jgi:predicted AAA+ superfamily ATPase
MRPMSLFESGHSIRTISLEGLLAGRAAQSVEPGLTLPDITERLAVGGWPGLTGLSTPAAMRVLSGYVDEIRRADINRVAPAADGGGRERDPARVARLLQALARNVATPASITRLAADTAEAGEQLARNTVYDHLDALERLMLIENQPAWRPHLRSRRQLRIAPKRHLVDPSLAVAALGASPERLLRDINTLGFLFESLVVRDLRIYGQRLGASVAYYSDSTGLEVDAIVETRDGRWAAFEVKLGGPRPIDEAAARLLRFARQVDTAKAGPPACLGVITATGYGQVRKDGVAVIPIGSLGP